MRISFSQVKYCYLKALCKPSFQIWECNDTLFMQIALTETQNHICGNAATVDTFIWQLQFGQQGARLSNKTLLRRLMTEIYSQLGSVVSAEPTDVSSPYTSQSSAQTWWPLPLQSWLPHKGQPRSSALWESPGPLGWSGAVSLKAGFKESMSEKEAGSYFYYCLILSHVFSDFLSHFTSFQQSNTHGWDLDDVFVVSNVSSEHSGSLGGKTTGVQLHDLLTSLKDLHKKTANIQII